MGRIEERCKKTTFFCVIFLPFPVNLRFLDTIGVDTQKGEINPKTDPVLGEVDLGSGKEEQKTQKGVGLVNGERSHMTYLWNSKNFLLGEGRYDIELEAITQLDKEFVSFFSALFWGRILAASNPVPVQAGLVDSGCELAQRRWR